MKVFLMYPDRDFEEKGLPFNADDIIEDLGLQIVFNHMSRGDHYLLDVSKEVLLNPLSDKTAILYRQEILKDTLRNPEVIRSLYQLTIDVEENKREKWWGIFGWKTPTNILSGARKTLEALLEFLKKLREMADNNKERFQSRGFRRFFEMIQKELDDDYLKEFEKQLETLKFSKGVLLSVSLGKGNEGENYILSKPLEKNWLQKLLSREKVYSYKLHPRDEAGAQALDDLKNKGIHRAATVVACAAKHIESFFKKLRKELAFYVAALNLAEDLRKLGSTISFPAPLENGGLIQFKNLYNISLALAMKKGVVSNDLSANGKEVFIITGANRGGKTTFLRSIGQAVLMMQAGMFVTASYFSSRIHEGVFTHFRREEDKNLRMGKFEEELSRMDKIVSNIKPGALLLLNEFLSSTNEREGSEIAYQIVKALLENQIRIFYVTHMYALARRFSEDESVMFLRAERTPSGERTFKIKEGKPLPTSFGIDIYKKLFDDYSKSSIEV